MDTKLLIINIATKLFQQKGYIGVGLNEILKECGISKGSLYHHFPNGKEELLMACLHSLNEAITGDIKEIFEGHSTTKEATNAMIEKLIVNFEAEGTLSGYTFSSIVSEMASLSDSVRKACTKLYSEIQTIYFHKLVADGFTNEEASSIALMITASIEGAMLLCLMQKTMEPLQVVSQLLPQILETRRS
ncbi:transcriptional regulator, TetR family [Psychrobacillus sp. OK028]|uniref:TetR/AcrR family transcriptional regulator n=1 Tax=Psychrobacillus sp. OK028 TaxID=1884359 RepID=UPI00088C71CE|nr:TetR/AcrR family transcriptional regulator [Psychrobacillus sp. OK028]SDN29807.1 transcriptional regulator, TetR family [Psychrobacillus sp. OK028]